MNVKVLCCFLFVGFALSAKIPKNEVQTKLNDEETYGELEDRDPNLQKDQDYYDEEDEDNDKNDDSPAIKDNDEDAELLSKPEIFTQKIGDLVQLPCQTTGNPVKIWQKGMVPVFQGPIQLQGGKNLVLDANGNLQVTLNDDDDFGDYKCRIIQQNDVHPEIVHTIVKEEEPRIIELYAKDNQTVLSPGDTLTLTCRATGYPKPRISWHKGNERLGTEGETITIQNVKAKHVGSYRCLADNKVGHPNHKHINIYVNHQPIVSVEKYIVNSDKESDAELICLVNAYPSPVVLWQKNGQNLVEKPPKIIFSRVKNNERNILIIKDIAEDDFGTYTCVAQNSYGKIIKNITLVKTPVVRRFEKASNESKDVVLTWRVESKQPISMHELQFRRKGEISWKTISPEVTNSDNDEYLIKQTLKGLDPGVYETRARSQNSHGWSEYSEIMPFEGAKHGSHHQKSKHSKKEQNDTLEDPSHDTPAQHRSEDTPLRASTFGGSSSTSLIPSLVLVTITLLTTFVHVRH